MLIWSVWAVRRDILDPSTHMFPSLAPVPASNSHVRWKWMTGELLSARTVRPSFSEKDQRGCQQWGSENGVYWRLYDWCRDHFGFFQSRCNPFEQAESPRCACRLYRAVQCPFDMVWATCASSEFHIGNPCKNLLMVCRIAFRHKRKRPYPAKENLEHFSGGKVPAKKVSAQFFVEWKAEYCFCQKWKNWAFICLKKHKCKRSFCYYQKPHFFSVGAVFLPDRIFLDFWKNE